MILQTLLDFLSMAAWPLRARNRPSDCRRGSPRGSNSLPMSPNPGQKSTLPWAIWLQKRFPQRHSLPIWPQIQAEVHPSFYQPSDYRRGSPIGIVCRTPAWESCTHTPSTTKSPTLISPFPAPYLWNAGWFLLNARSQPLFGQRHLGLEVAPTAWCCREQVLRLLRQDLPVLLQQQHCPVHGRKLPVHLWLLSGDLSCGHKNA